MTYDEYIAEAVVAHDAVPRFARIDEELNYWEAAFHAKAARIISPGLVTFRKEPRSVFIRQTL